MNHLLPNFIFTLTCRIRLFFFKCPGAYHKVTPESLIQEQDFGRLEALAAIPECAEDMKYSYKEIRAETSNA